MKATAKDNKVNITVIISCNWVYNEADRLETSSILIYSTLEQGIYTQNGWQEAMSIKGKLKGGN
jgi:hypothetical protein